MKLVVTGAENSGTGLVTSLMRELGAEVIHRAVPHVGRLTDWHPLYDYRNVPIDAILFVARHFPAQEASQQARSGRASTALDAMHHAAAMAYELHAPLYVLTYEAIVHEWPESLVSFARFLGFEDEAIERAADFTVTDENAKHYA